MKILLVEDDRLTASVLSELLVAQHYIVETAIDGEMAQSLIAASSYDLIVLDVVIPKLDGMSLCRQLRSQGYQKPILLLTTKALSGDVVRGLDAGADDYVTKPYHLPELLARIRALLRRSELPIAPNVLTWGQLCVNPVTAEVTFSGHKIDLTAKEYGLLGLFLRHPQQIFSRSDLVDRLWSIDATPAEGTVTNLIKDLRQKLKAGGLTVDLLETVYGLGYRLREPQPKALAKDPLPKQPNLTRVHQVLKQYQITFADRTEILAQVEQALAAATLTPALQHAAAQEAHKLAGTIGSFGYTVGSQLVQAIEPFPHRPTPLQPTDQPQFAHLLSRLKQELTQLPVALGETTTRVLVIDRDQSFTSTLQAAAQNWGLELDVQNTLSSVQFAATYNAVVVDLSPQTQIAAKLSQLQASKQQFPTLPILVLDQQDDLAMRVAAARIGVQRFLHKPLTAAEVLDAIVQVLPRSRPTVAKVMALDDDGLMLERIRQLLQPWGVQVTTLQDSAQFWHQLTVTAPDLLLMDLQMPTFSGIDLCSVVRQDPKWGNLPILVVTAYTDLESIQQVFAAGADDFISKPIAGPELVTRVISRIDRSRLQQNLEAMKGRIGQ